MAFGVRPRATAALALVALLAAAAPAPADPQTAHPIPAAVEPPEPKVEWNPQWHKFRWWEYMATPAIQALSLYIRWYRPPPDEAKWVGYNPVDDTVRNLLVEDSLSDREYAGLVSDRVAQVGGIIPWAVDLPVVVLGYRQYRLAWQMMWMNFEAIAVANLLNNSSFYLVGRGRPSTHNCEADPSYDPICGGIGNNASFPSGHTVTIATAAGLTCIHHQRLPIFGNEMADRGACVAMLLGTFVTGATRIMADRHFTSDVLMGATIGFGSGYFLPTLLHYGPRHPREPEQERETALPVPRSVSLIPFGTGQSVGLGVFGLL